MPQPIPLDTLRLAVVTPMANEVESAERFVEAVRQAGTPFGEMCHIVVIDAASTDGTRALLESLARDEPLLQVVWAPENRSVVDAYLRGYREALARGFDWILEIDAGFSHDPAEFARFLPHIAAGVDCVFGSRRLVGGSVRDTPWWRRAISTGGTRLSNALLGTRLTDMTSGYQAFSAEALGKILDRGIKSRAHFFQTEMKFHARSMTVAEVPISYRAASPSVRPWVIRDAIVNLGRLVWSRMRGRGRDR